MISSFKKCHILCITSLLRTKHISPVYYICKKCIYSKTGIWDKELTLETKIDIENFWKDRCVSWKDEDATNSTKEKCYILSMFPYPSGKLHMGHVRVYTISDTLARFYRMNGKQVLHPMGWDAFGLPAENAAIERGIDPASWTNTNITTMRSQLQQLGCSFDWSKEFSTCDPNYYKWTQYLFLKMFEKGLAYQKMAHVNWDPIDKTVLADEQVDDNGLSWRSGAKVEKKILKQWFLRTTMYSKLLYDGLNDPILENWRDITNIQQHWIGECTGYSFVFRLRNGNDILDDHLTIWTDIPEALYGVTFIVVSPAHVLNMDTTLSKQVNNTDDKQLDVVAIHPLTNRTIPIFVSDTITFPEGADAHIGIPGENEEDANFARKHRLDIVKIFSGDHTEIGANIQLINSNEFDGMNLEDARHKICQKAQEMGAGGYSTSSKLRDWLISRQRYWGTPIPIIHCPNCHAVPVPYTQLPVLLPKVSVASENGTSHLKNNKEWLNVTCPKCGSLSQRETDTMDTFVDSSWYYYRFLDPHNDIEPFKKEKVNKLMPVDIYIGGKEHAALHLYYARFVSYFCYNLGLTDHKEPFKRLLPQGMVKGQTYSLNGKYLKHDEVEQQGKKVVERNTKAPVTSQWEKMSKSRHNGVDPSKVIEEYGVDTTRLFMLGDVAPSSDRNWSSATFPGHLNWQSRVWLTVGEFRNYRMSQDAVPKLSPEKFNKEEELMFDSRNYFLKSVTQNFRASFQFSTAISRIQGLTKSIRRAPPDVVCRGLQYERALRDLIIMMSPIMPHFASELWKGLVETPGNMSQDVDWTKDVLNQPWPVLDLHYKLDLKMKINDEEMYVIKVDRSTFDKLNEELALSILRGDKRTTEHLRGHTPQNIIFRFFPEYAADVNFIIPVLLKQKKPSKV